MNNESENQLYDTERRNEYSNDNHTWVAAWLLFGNNSPNVGVLSNALLYVVKHCTNIAVAEFI